jgi:hypothetical protein
MRTAGVHFLGGEEAIDQRVSEALALAAALLETRSTNTRGDGGPLVGASF